MTNEQLNEVEHNLGLDSISLSKGHTPLRVEVILTSREMTLTGDYERSKNGTLVILRRGVSVHWINIDSIAAIGVINQ